MGHLMTFNPIIPSDHIEDIVIANLKCIMEEKENRQHNYCREDGKIIAEGFEADANRIQKGPMDSFGQEISSESEREH